VDEAVRAIRILHEVLRIPARISTAVLREEDAIGVTNQVELVEIG
jgi:hypothetical protein